MLLHRVWALFFQNKSIKPSFDLKYLCYFISFLLNWHYVDPIMANDSITSLKPLIALVQDQEELEKTLFNVNVSQWLHEHESTTRIIHTLIDQSTLDHWLFPNSHTLTIFLKFIFVHGNMLKTLKNVNVKTMIFVFTIELGFLTMAIIIINQLSMEHCVECRVHTNHHIPNFL